MPNEGAHVQSVTRTIRTGLTSRALSTCVLGAVLPTLLLTSLQAELILFHTHCDGETHAHRLASADSRSWPGRHTEADACCDSGARGVADAQSTVPAADCGHNQADIVIAMGPFLTTPRLSHADAVRPGKNAGLAFPAAALSDPRAGRGTWVRSEPSGPAHAAGSTIPTILSRNHALLL